VAGAEPSDVEMGDVEAFSAAYPSLRDQLTAFVRGE
jgi:hypothetical protein